MVAPKGRVFWYLSTCEWFPSQEESRAERYRRSRSPSFGKARGGYDDTAFFFLIAELGGDLRDFLDFGRLVSHKIYTSCYVSGGKSKMLRGEVQDAGGSLRFLPESAPAKTPPEKHLRLEQKGRPSNHSNDFLLTLMCCTFNIS